MTPVVLGEGLVGISGFSSPEGELYTIIFHRLPKRYPQGADISGEQAGAPLAEVQFVNLKAIEVLHGILTSMLEHARKSSWKIERVDQ